MNTFSKAFFLLPALVVASVTRAQPQYYVDVSADFLPPDIAGACMDASAADADNDGDLDLALAMEFQTNILLRNDGSGRFTDASDNLPRTVHDSEDVAFADFDLDGDLDLVFVSEDDRIDELYLNNGDGSFSNANDRLGWQDVSNALAVFDFDGDGAPDLLTGNIGTDRLLLNDGAGSFTDETLRFWPQSGESRTQDLELADIDGDGDLDVLVGNEGQNEIFLNDGGRLIDVTLARLPALDDETREIRAVDIDADGDPDLVVANVRFLRQDVPQDYILLNDGDGVFSRSPDTDFPEDARSNFTLQTLDIDRDGDLDVLVPSTVFATTTFDVFLQTMQADGQIQIYKTARFGLNDENGDGTMDAMVAVGDGYEPLFYVDGKLQMPEGLALEQQGELQTYDSDNDGQMEFSIANVSLDQFVESLAEVKEDALYLDTSMDLFDIGNDGNIDIFAPRTTVMNEVGNTQVLLNDGAGHFVSAAASAILPASVSGNTFDIEVADFNGDGIDDLFFCNRASLNDAAVLSGGQPVLLFGQP